MTDELPVLDGNVIEELRASVDGDAAFVNELVAEYVAEGPRHLADMRAAAVATDAAAIVRPAHTLKSNSATLGATRLAQICRQIELAGREGQAEKLAEAVDSAEATWRETLDQLAALGFRG